MIKGESTHIISTEHVRNHLQFLALTLCMCGFALLYSDESDSPEVARLVGLSPAYGPFFDSAQRALYATNPFDEPSEASNISDGYFVPNLICMAFVQVHLVPHSKCQAALVSKSLPAMLVYFWVSLLWQATVAPCAAPSRVYSKLTREPVQSVLSPLIGISVSLARSLSFIIRPSFAFTFRYHWRWLCALGET